MKIVEREKFANSANKQSQCTVLPSSYSGGRILWKAVSAWPHCGWSGLLQEPSMVLYLLNDWRQSSFTLSTASLPQLDSSSSSSLSWLLSALAAMPPTACPPGKLTRDFCLAEVFWSDVFCRPKVGRANVPWFRLRPNLFENRCWTVSRTFSQRFIFYVLSK